MMYEIKTAFPDTESAHSAARRIRDSGDDVYSIQMSYITRNGRDGALNNIYYTPPSMSVFPTGFDSLSQSLYLPTDNTRTSHIEFGEVCSVTVVTSEHGLESVRGVMYNSGGYDTIVKERDE